MTLRDRNVFFKAGIVISALCTILVLLSCFSILPAYSMMEENNHRPPEIIQVFISRFLKVNYIAVHASLVMAVLFSFVALILIHYYFEQTQVPEIIYIAFFTVSFSFEIFRLIVPLQNFVSHIPSLYLLIASRILLFSRYFGIFSLFEASVCAAGFSEDKSRNIIMIIVIAALIITLGVPIDTQIWDTSLNMVNGFTSMFRLIEAVMLITTVASFFIAVNVRGSKEYAFIGLGALLALVGRNILLGTDNWASPISGILMLSLGIWFICSKLHKLHLWL
jgi:hypothetical protein